MSTLRVLRIVDGTSVDGPGLRTSVYLAGCTHHCEGCHNPDSHDPMGGIEMSTDEILDHLVKEDYPVTFSGGDPMFQAAALLPLLIELKERNVNIWLYTGYRYEEVAADTVMSALLPYLDVMVDGRFILSQRDTDLIFRGSPNQRLIDVPATLASGHPVTVNLP